MPLMRVYLVCLLLIGVVVAGCGGGGTAESPPTPTPGPAELVTQIGAATRDTESLAFTIEFTGAPVYADPVTRQFQLIGVEGELQRPDAALASIRVRNIGAVAIIRLVSLDDSVYVTNPITRDWFCVPPDTVFDPVALFDPESGVDQLIREEFTDVELVGVEELGETARPHYHLRGTIPGEPLSAISFGLIGQGTVEADVWADVESQRMTRLVLVDAGVDPESADSEEAEPTTWTINFSNYNEEVDIRAPITCEE